MDTAVKTAETGYMQRRLVKVTNSFTIGLLIGNRFKGPVGNGENYVYPGCRMRIIYKDTELFLKLKINNIRIFGSYHFVLILWAIIQIALH